MVQLVQQVDGMRKAVEKWQPSHLFPYQHIRLEAWINSHYKLHRSSMLLLLMEMLLSYRRALGLSPHTALDFDIVPMYSR